MEKLTTNRYTILDPRNCVVLGPRGVNRKRLPLDSFEGLLVYSLFMTYCHSSLGEPSPTQPSWWNVHPNPDLNSDNGHARRSATSKRPRSGVRHQEKDLPWNQNMLAFSTFTSGFQVPCGSRTVSGRWPSQTLIHTHRVPAHAFEFWMTEFIALHCIPLAVMKCDAMTEFI